MSKKSKLSSLDAFARPDEEVRIRTKMGGIITISCILTTLYLLSWEWSKFREVISKPQLVVDRDHSSKLELNLDISFPNVPCDFINLDIMDDSGDLQLDVLEYGFTKTRLDPDGKVLETDDFDMYKQDGAPSTDPNYCGPCYGSIDQSKNDEVEASERVCCQTCEDVRKAYVKAGWAFYDGKGIEQCEQEGYVKKINSHLNEGCRVAGSASLNRIQGNIHFAPGKSFQTVRGHFHDQSLYERNPQLNFNHIIHHFSFGKEIPTKLASRHSKNIVNPLDGRSVAPERDTHLHQFSYYTKIVPTRFEYLNKAVVDTAQFSATYHDRPLRGGADDDHPNTFHFRSGIPGVFFFFDASPIKVINKEYISGSWSSFFLNCITSIGGVLAVGSMLDRLMYKAQRSFLGKKSQ
ncbi:hypothetical protein Kpol_538p34 [Vanderwaltozyma polyspora DSM 70294]|uniref:Endoplasmic reticulum-Golgi intermediate compartment protein n=1 Tax=Vanderwaltozyma polyspora (strain ATCC 22028 / DSM 70294 / BCRC 21397 / CBS 2163 / NBRC 10782 / NRRL Y-8283 / UCD 57-17) TaxID=436907 RepID=A7TKE7_VANPO|nr:uncharacterized protein Kpol_538p34 [Vanderwaltozyma polyspora DSM 70294]EDO17274.1 hypothetical protein Kpol_538p34 [Vanderwaltozyma polyspora DSM 70294]